MKNKKRRPTYLKKYDIIVYGFIIFVLSSLFIHINDLEEVRGNKAEVFVDNSLKYVFNLSDEKKEYFVDTNLGGVDVEVAESKIRVTTSNSPLKICVKQGYISNIGDTIIGVPDKLLIKIVGEQNDDDIDIILR